MSLQIVKIHFLMINHIINEVYASDSDKLRINLELILNPTSLTLVTVFAFIFPMINEWIKNIMCTLMYKGWSGKFRLQPPFFYFHFLSFFFKFWKIISRAGHLTGRIFHEHPTRLLCKRFSCIPERNNKKSYHLGHIQLT